MKKLNIDVNNQCYAVLDTWFNGTEKEAEKLEYTLNFLAGYYGQNWVLAECVDLLI